jgi:ribosomal protein S18 acetylase RimI-like enzyme
VASPDAVTRRQAGIISARIGGGAAVLVRDDSTHVWTKALGFGFAEPVTRGLIGQITDFYRKQGATEAKIQLAPPVIPADWDEIRARENLSAGRKAAKVYCETEVAVSRAALAPDQGLRVGPVGPAQATEWAGTMMRVFGMPDECCTAMIGATAGRKGWHPYAVWAGDQIVAGACMHVHGDTAQFFGAATVPEYRGRGAQTALIAARARAARGAGCRWLIAETSAEAPGEHHTSLANLRRVGFEVLYERVTWTWRPEAAAAA